MKHASRQILQIYMRQSVTESRKTENCERGRLVEINI